MAKNPAELARIYTAPRTPEEYLIALTHPDSLIKKATDNLVMERASIRIKTIKLLRILARQDMLKKRAELEELLKHGNSVDAYMEMRRQEEAGRPLAVETEAVVHNLEVKRTDVGKQINMVESRHEQLVEALQAANKRLNDVNVAWDQSQKNATKELMDGLTQALPDIEKDQERKRQIEAAFQVTTPVKILNINPALLNVLDMPLEKNKQDPVRELGAVMETRVNFVRELNVLANIFKEKLDEEFDPAKFLKQLRNKPAINVPKCKPADATIICDAITGVCQKKKVETDIQQVAKELEALKKKRQVLNEELKIARANAPDNAKGRP
jgi:hypothetical protein